MNWNVGKPILVILLLLLDLLLINNIVQNKKQEVLGVKTIYKENSAKKIKPKISPPVLSYSLVSKKYPTLTLTPTVSPTPSPTQTPSSSNSTENKSMQNSSVNIVEPKASAQIKTVLSSINSPYSLIQQINQYRSSKGMSQLSENTETCAFASTRASEIVSNFNHDGFTSRTNSNSLPYPTYSSVAENISMNGDSNQVVPGWIDSPGHNENLSKDVPYGCVRNSGNYYAFEAWKP